MINVGLLKNTRNSQKSNRIEYRQESNSGQAQFIRLAVPESEKRVMNLSRQRKTRLKRKGGGESALMFSATGQKSDWKPVK
jgi:hypothetical protein